MSNVVNNINFDAAAWCYICKCWRFTLPNARHESLLLMLIAQRMHPVRFQPRWSILSSQVFSELRPTAFLCWGQKASHSLAKKRLAKSSMAERRMEHTVYRIPLTSVMTLTYKGCVDRGYPMGEARATTPRQEQPPTLAECTYLRRRNAELSRTLDDVSDRLFDTMMTIDSSTSSCEDLDDEMRYLYIKKLTIKMERNRSRKELKMQKHSWSMSCR